MQQDERLAITVREAAKLLRLSRNAAYVAAAAGAIPSVRVGGRVLVPRKRLEEWLDRSTDHDDPYTARPERG
jgi:excisionase family DNA binding protein